MWAPLTKYVEPETLDRLPEKKGIPLRHRSPSDPFVFFASRSQEGGVRLILAHHSGYDEFPAYTRTITLEGIGYMVVGSNSDRLWRLHTNGPVSLEATMGRIRALLALGAEQTQILGPKGLYGRFEKSLDFHVNEIDWIESCQDHWLVQCLNQPDPPQEEKKQTG